MRFLVLLPVLMLLACGEPNTVDAVAPSPLATVDKDRLYLLVKAGGGVKPICNDYFAAPASPTNSVFTTECVAWAKQLTEHLRLNGVNNLAPRHLQEPVFWQWWAQAITNIAACRDEIQRQDVVRRANQSPGWRLPNMPGFRDCDPYDRAIQGEGQSLEDLGIRRRPGSLEGSI